MTFVFAKIYRVCFECVFDGAISKLFHIVTGRLFF